MVKHCPLKDKEKEIICCFDEVKAAWPRVGWTFHIEGCLIGIAMLRRNVMCPGCP